MILLRRILVPVDFSKFSDNALRYAAAFGEKFGAELHLFHVVQDLALFMPDAVAVVPPVLPPVEEFMAAAQAAFERTVDELKLPPLNIHKIVREGTPFYEIVRYAKEADVDLIVMGTHGRSGLVHVLLGSVTERVIRKAPCPVLTVRHPEHEFVHP